MASVQCTPVELTLNGDSGDAASPAAGSPPPAASHHEEAVRQLEMQAVSLDGGARHASQPSRQAQDGRRIQTQGLPPASRQYGSGGRIMAPSEEPPGGLMGSGGGGGALQSVRQWGYNAYKCTLQLVSERLGRATRTADLELDGAVAGLRESRRRYEALLNLATGLTKHFQGVSDTQRVLADAFWEMARHEPPGLAGELERTAEGQRALHRSGEQLLVALNAFCTALGTLVTRSFEDTLRTVSSYEYARVEFDAYRRDLDALSVSPGASRNGASVAKAEELKQQFEARRQKYERLKEDVRIKLKFLDENKIRVMQKQLRLFQSAVSAYFSGNQEALEAALAQINKK